MKTLKVYKTEATAEEVCSDLEERFNKLEKCIHSVSALKSLLHCPPDTWKEYSGHTEEDIDAIVNMEIEELNKATEEKRNCKTEYLHCAAAFLNAFMWTECD